MRRVHVVVVCVTMFLGVFAKPADAQWWGWFEELNGPGPSIGLGWDFKLVCGYPSEEGIEPTTDCVFLKRNNREVERRWSAGAEVSAHWTKSNDLTYAQFFQDSDKTATILAIGPFFDYRFCQCADIGVTVAANRFSGDPFESFWRVSIEPRITVRLLDLTRGEQKVRTGRLSIAAGVLLFPQGFDDVDFGAVPGTFHMDLEPLFTVKLVVDIDRWR